MVAEVLKQRESAEQAIDLLCDQLTKVKKRENINLMGSQGLRRSEFKNARNGIK